jgi:glycosyltransferase involved in cell wall biosynthesis
MPTHRGELWLSGALDSVCAERADGIEVILLDSSPDDGTCALARTYADRLDLVIRHNTTLTSWVEKTNRAARMARGKYLALLHQDDYWLPGRVPAVKQWLAADPSATMHLHPCLVVDRNSVTLGPWRCPLPADRPIPSKELLESLLVQNFIAIPAPVFSRETFLEVGGMDPELWYTADWDLWLKIGARGVTRYHDAPLACFRVHGSSQTMTGSRSPENMRRQEELVFSRHIAHSDPVSRERIARRARTSIAVNSALVSAMGGKPTAILSGALALARLGPFESREYLRVSRIGERVWPRIKAWVRGDL